MWNAFALKMHLRCLKRQKNKQYLWKFVAASRFCFFAIFSVFRDFEAIRRHSENSCIQYLPTNKGTQGDTHHRVRTKVITIRSRRTATADFCLQLLCHESEFGNCDDGVVFTSLTLSFFDSGCPQSFLFYWFSPPLVFFQIHRGKQ